MALNDSSGPASRRWLGLTLGALVTSFALYMLAHTVDWRSALQYLRQIRWPWLLAALAVIFINNLAKALRWRQLFPLQQGLPRRRDALGSLMAGQFLNFTLPFRSGDISRAYFLGRYRGESSAAAAGTIGAEKVLDLVVMGGLFVWVLPHFILPAWVEAGKGSVRAVSLGALGVWLAVVVGLPYSKRALTALARRWPALGRATSIGISLLDGFASLRGRQLPIILLWTLAAWAASIGATYAMLMSLSLPASLPLAILANVIVQGGLSVPVAPAGVGVFEWLAILALAIAGIPNHQGLAYGLTAHAVVLFFPVIIGVPWLLSRFRS